LNAGLPGTNRLEAFPDLCQNRKSTGLPVLSLFYPSLAEDFWQGKMRAGD